MAGVEQLVQQWRHDATLLRQYKNQLADWLEDRATELETALTQQDAHLLHLTEAGRISGYTAAHLERWRKAHVLASIERARVTEVVL